MKKLDIDEIRLLSMLEVIKNVKISDAKTYSMNFYMTNCGFCTIGYIQARCSGLKCFLDDENNNRFELVRQTLKKLIKSGIVDEFPKEIVRTQAKVHCSYYSINTPSNIFKI